MDKQSLHKVLMSIPIGQDGVPLEDTFITINFLQEYKTFSGEYKVLESKSGRGKGGSRVVRLMDTKTGQLLEGLTVGDKLRGIGTPVSDYILNLTMNGVTTGSEEEGSSPKDFPRDEVAARALNAVMRPLKDKEGTKIRVVSSQPDYNGEWTVVGGKLSAGRFGQVILDLVNGDRAIELWSYRHSGIIESLTIESEETTETVS